ncbi:6662_t:CDS:1, partial [Dentiscutata heterogama]
ASENSNITYNEELNNEDRGLCVESEEAEKSESELEIMERYKKNS